MLRCSDVKQRINPPNILNSLHSTPTRKNKKLHTIPTNHLKMPIIHPKKSIIQEMPIIQKMYNSSKKCIIHRKNPPNLPSTPGMLSPSGQLWPALWWCAAAGKSARRSLATCRPEADFEVKTKSPQGHNDGQSRLYAHYNKLR